MHLSLEEVRTLALRALTGSGASEHAAGIVATSMRDAEAEGLPNIGLAYLTVYCEHLRCGKVDGHVLPTVQRAAPAILVADAHYGFAHVAFDAVLDDFVALTEQSGAAVLAIQRSYSAGVVGWFVDLLARRGLVSLAFANSSALMPAWGASTPLFGTNPLGFSAPRAGADPVVVDMAVSTTARVNVVAAANRGEPIPDGWALDRHGRPTNDPAEALAGMNAPLGGAKGFGLALMVDVLAGALTASHLSHEASDFIDNDGGPPGTGQLFVAFSPAAFGAPDLADRVANLGRRVTADPSVRMPGDRRHEARRRVEIHGIEVPDELMARLEEYAIAPSAAPPNRPTGS